MVSDTSTPYRRQPDGARPARGAPIVTAWRLVQTRTACFARYTEAGVIMAAIRAIARDDDLCMPPDELPCQ